MAQRLSAEQNELYQRVDEVLHYLWDPIGVSGVPEARDEYDSYVPHVFSLLIHGADAQAITDFLQNTETVTMGLSDTARARERAHEVTSILENYREVIRERQTNA